MSNVTAIKPRSATAPVWLSPEQVCERVPGLTKVRLADLRDRGLGPAYQKPTARTVIYRADDVDAWVEASRVGTREQS